MVIVKVKAVVSPSAVSASWPAPHSAMASFAAPAAHLAIANDFFGPAFGRATHDALASCWSVTANAL
jgi:hypothetical protein